MEPSELKAGQIITFGSYFKNSGGKKEPLEWRILETDGCTALLISTTTSILPYPGMTVICENGVIMIF